MKVGFLGTAGAVTSARRGNTSLVVAAGTLLLVDCSGNPPQAVARLGLDWTRIEHIVLTHHHADHLDGLPALVHQLRLLFRHAPRPPLSIWAPERALEAARGLLAAVDLVDREEMFALSFRPLGPAASPLELGDLQVLPFAVEHGDVPTCGLCVVAPDEVGSSLVYSADTEPCAAVWRHARGARLLVHECSSFEEPAMAGHTTLAELEQRLTETDAADVRLVHLPPVTESEEQVARARLAARFGDRVRLAEDGELLNLSRKEAP